MNSESNDVSTISIGFVGAGRMAQALAQGIASSESFAAARVCFFDPNDHAAELFQDKHPRAERCNDLSSVAAASEFLILAVKPQVMLSVLNDLNGSVNSQHLVASVAAGISIATYQKQLGVERVVRVMPNTPCLIGNGVSGVAISESASKSDCQLVVALMQAVGKVLVVDEGDLDGVTGLSGSGPAYVFRFIEGLVSGGEACGLTAEQSRMLAVQTVLGAAALVEASPDQSLTDLTAQVTSPGGTTLAGLTSLEKNNFKKIVESAVIAAKERSIELAAT